MVIMERLPVAVILLSLLKGKFFFFYMLASCLCKNKCTKPVYQENVKKKNTYKNEHQFKYRSHDTGVYMKQSNMTVLFHSWLSKLCVTRLYNRFKHLSVGDY